MRKNIIILAGLLTLGTSIALAHHSAAAFDTTTEKTITGVVKKFDYTNPHSWVWLDVTTEQGAVETWGVEGMSPNYLGRRGWSRTTLKPGDKLTIKIRPMRDGSKAGMWVSATRPDGEVLMMGGAITDP